MPPYFTNLFARHQRTALFSLPGLLLILTLLAACESKPLPPLPVWQSSEGLAHADLGRIVDLASGRTLTADELIQQLSAAPLVLVGEQHDNLGHHALELWLLQALQARRAQGSVLLEMLDDGQQLSVEQAQLALRSGQPPADLPAALNWRSDWDWSAYAPLVGYALAQPWPLLSANFERGEMMQIYRHPAPLNGALSTAQPVLNALREQIRDSHCNLLPEAQLPNMLAVQQQRDRRMAERLLTAPKPALLVAGAFHVRRDLGVPLHLADLGQPYAKVLILAQVGQPVTQEMADFVWYSAALPKQDYCESLRQSAH